MLTSLPIRIKTLLAPLVILCLCLGVAAVSVMLLRNQGATFRDVVGGAFVAVTTSSRASLAMTAIHSDLIHRINRIQRNPVDPEDDHEDGTATLESRLDEVEAMLQSIETNDQVVDEELMRSTGELLAIYRTVAVQVSRSSTLNPRLVSSLMAHYSQVDAHLRAMSGQVLQTARARQQSTEGFIERSIAGLLAIVVATLSASLVVTVLLGRAVAYPLASMTRMMSRLAGGDTDIRVMGLDRRDEIGEMARAVEIFRTQTQRLREHDAELADMVQRLSDACAEADQASRAKSEFLAGMSHELRTPLNAILGYAQILQWEQGLNERQQCGLKTIEQAGDHLLSLIDEVLDLAKIEAGRVELRLAPIDLGAFLQGISNIIRVRAHDKGLRFVLDAPPVLPTIVADDRRLRQILLNLLGNAVKFTDVGEVRLAVRLGPHDSAGGAGGLRLHFEVHDSGVGISESDQARLFQPFEQVGDLRRRRGGTGLGLAISRQLAQVMGSDIALCSVEGRGSVFSFVLDASSGSDHASEKVAAAPAVAYEGTRKTILVVDDVAHNRAVIGDLLRPMGFEVIEADNGTQSLELASAYRPDLILMDSVMPGMDGAEAIRHLRAAPATRDTPVITVSANVLGSARDKALASGATAVVTKPIDAARLLQLLEQHLGVRLLRQPAAH